VLFECWLAGDGETLSSALPEVFLNLGALPTDPQFSNKAVAIRLGIQYCIRQIFWFSRRRYRYILTL
jgi:hypothetical protein